MSHRTKVFCKLADFAITGKIFRSFYIIGSFSLFHYFSFSLFSFRFIYITLLRCVCHVFLTKYIWAGKLWWKAWFAVENGVCVTQWNILFKRFFSQLKFVKTNLETSLQIKNLFSRLCIKESGPGLLKCHGQHIETGADIWYKRIRGSGKWKKIHLTLQRGCPWTTLKHL